MRVPEAVDPKRNPIGFRQALKSLHNLKQPFGAVLVFSSRLIEKTDHTAIGPLRRRLDAVPPPVTDRRRISASLKQDFAQSRKLLFGVNRLHRHRLPLRIPESGKQGAAGREAGPRRGSAAALPPYC